MKYLSFFLKSVDSDARIVAAEVTVKVVDKRPFNAILEQYSDKTNSTGKD
jgi:hypothetical protein